jgi:hypothetical protein
MVIRASNSLNIILYEFSSETGNTTLSIDNVRDEPPSGADQPQETVYQKEWLEWESEAVAWQPWDCSERKVQLRVLI